MARKNGNRELFKCRTDVKVTAQNKPPSVSIRCSPSVPPHHLHQFVLLLCHPGCCPRLTCLNEALSVTTLKSDSFINKISFPVQHYYFIKQRLCRGALDRIYIFTFKLSCPPDFSCYFSFEPESRSHSLRVREILVINCGFSKTNGSVRRYRFNIYLPALVLGVCGCAVTHITVNLGPLRVG